MKTLLILRHAKTQSDAPAGDHARELTERGHRNAAAMGAYIHNLTGTPDAIITSDATRARQTAEIVATAVDFAAPLTVEPRIYAADLDTLLAVVRRIPDEVHTAIIVGHNPGFEELAEALAGNHDEGFACRPRDSPSWSSTSSAGMRCEQAQVAYARWPRRARSPDRPMNLVSRVRTL